MVQETRFCSDCKHWTMGEMWQYPKGKGHGTPLESKGWCFAKPNKRKRWNYCSASKCKLFDEREQNSLSAFGHQNLNGDLEIMTNFKF